MAKSISEKNLTRGLRTVPATSVQMSPPFLELFEKRDVSNDATEEAYTFERSFGGTHGHIYQSSASAWNHPKWGYLCDFVHSVTIRRNKSFIVTEHQARIRVGSNSPVKKVFTFKNGSDLYAPFVGINLQSQGSVVGPSRKLTRNGSTESAMYPMYIEFGEVKRGDSTLSATKTFRTKSNKPLNEISSVVVVCTWLGQIGIDV